MPWSIIGGEGVSDGVVTIPIQYRSDTDHEETIAVTRALDTTDIQISAQNNLRLNSPNIQFPNLTGYAGYYLILGEDGFLSLVNPNNQAATWRTETELITNVNDILEHTVYRVTPDQDVAEGFGEGTLFLSLGLVWRYVIVRAYVGAAKVYEETYTGFGEVRFDAQIPVVTGFVAGTEVTVTVQALSDSEPYTVSDGGYLQIVKTLPNARALDMVRVANPLVRLMAMNNLAPVLDGVINWLRPTTVNFTDRYGQIRSAGIDVPVHVEKGWRIDDDIVHIQYEDNVPLPSKDLTIMWRLNDTGVTGTGVVFDNGLAANDAFRCSIDWVTGVVTVDNGTVNITTAAGVGYGERFALSQGDGILSLEVDGELVGAATTGVPSIAKGSVFWVGTDGVSSTNNIKATVNDFRIYDQTLTKAEISSYMGKE